MTTRGPRTINELAEKFAQDHDLLREWKARKLTTRLPEPEPELVENCCAVMQNAVCKTPWSEVPEWDKGATRAAVHALINHLNMGAEDA